MPLRYKGNDTILYLQDFYGAGTVLAAACNRNLELERVYEFIETTTLQGQEVGHVSGLKRGTVVFNNLSGFPIGNEADTLYFEETCRQWAENNTLLLCRWKDEPSGNSREIMFFAYITRYRAVRNNNEVANFDIDLVWTNIDTSIACPLVTIDNVNNGGVYEIHYSFPSDILASSYTIQLINSNDEVVDTTTVEGFSGNIEGIFSNVLPNAFYRINIIITGFETTTCLGDPFLSYNLPCPVVGLTVGETSVDYSIPNITDITRYIVQIASSLDPLTIVDFAVFDEPVPDPITQSFTGLSTTTTYYIRVTIQTLDPGVTYSRACSWIEFTTGTPFEPPTSTEYSGIFGNTLETICSDFPLTVYSDSPTWAPGILLYLDADLTIPLGGFTHVSYAGDVYNLDGNEVGTDTGNNCP